MQLVARPLTPCQADSRSFFKQAIKTKQQEAGDEGDDGVDGANAGYILRMFTEPSRIFLWFCYLCLGFQRCLPFPTCFTSSQLEDSCTPSIVCTRQRLVTLEDRDCLEAGRTGHRTEMKVRLCTEHMLPVLVGPEW